MKELLEYLQKLYTTAGYSGIAAVLGAIVAAFGSLSFVWKLILKLEQILQQRKLRKDLHPFYTAAEIQRATQYYVDTTCQNVAPSKEEEPRLAQQFAAREKILPFFLKKAFKPEQDDCQFYIVLADSGMGKTTLMINLYLRYTDQFKPPYQMKLLPLGFPGIDQELDKMPNDQKRQTILLLDAFDEDVQAVEDYKTRLVELIQKVVYFREVVITCRTQFFPREVEEPNETGILKVGPEAGAREFRKFYVSPFDDHDIRTYLRKRFAVWQWRKKRKARRIVTACPNLMVRPMLLSHIDDLLQSDSAYDAPHKVYAELIHQWVERETRKLPAARQKHYRQGLFHFSREIAVDMYRRRAERQSALLIPGDQMQAFANKHEIALNEMEMKSRSLLNRNAHGDYKFSHKSILEYFLAEEAFFNDAFRSEVQGFEGMNQARAFFQDMVYEKLTLPLFSRGDLQGEYALNNEKPKALANLPVKTLPNVTRLTLKSWQPDDDLLALQGLKQLKAVEFVGTALSAEQTERLQHALPDCKVLRRIPLRSEPLIVEGNDAPKIFGLVPYKLKIDDKTYDVWRPLEYIQNDYEDQGKVVLDRATGLTWQKAGSEQYRNYKDAQNYVAQLNRQKFAGYNDWRLPTIPELMSLLEPEKQSNDLYINPIFDKTERWCWSVDKRQAEGESSAESAWGVNFDNGYVD